MDRPRSTYPGGSPFYMLERLADEMDRIFDDFGLGRSRFMPRAGRGGLGAATRGESALWAPDVEVFQRGHDLVVRVDLPGVKKDEVRVEVTDDAITIEGERRHEEKTEREGIYRTERSYGSFCRTIALPDGVMSDQAKASFNDGVLEITMPVPPEQVSRGRRLEIQEGAATKTVGDTDAEAAWSEGDQRKPKRPQAGR